MTRDDKKHALSCVLLGLGAGFGLVLALMIFFPGLLNTPLPYHLEMEKEYITFHVDTTDFPMAALDQMIGVFKDNGVEAEAIVFVRNRKPVSQIRISQPKIKKEESK